MSEEELPTAVPYRFDRSAAAREESGGELRYPSLTRPQPPAGMSRRERRRWRREARAEQRSATRSAVAGWRQRPLEQVNGLAVVVLVLAVALATYVFLHHPAAHRTAPAATSPAAGVPAAPSSNLPTPAASSADAATSSATSSSGGLFDGADGRTVQQFVLGYLAYSPAAPDPGGTWQAAWSRYATDALRARAQAAEAGMWLFTTQRSVSALDVQVVSGSRAGETWSLTVSRELFPIGGSASSPSTTQTLPVQVQVTGGRVSDVQLGDPTEAASTATASPAPGAGSAD